MKNHKYKEMTNDELNVANNALFQFAQMSTDRGTAEFARKMVDDLNLELNVRARKRSNKFETSTQSQAQYERDMERRRQKYERSKHLKVVGK